jgi:hypothetical protein
LELEEEASAAAAMSSDAEMFSAVNGFAFLADCKIEGA